MYDVESLESNKEEYQIFIGQEDPRIRDTGKLKSMIDKGIVAGQVPVYKNPQDLFLFLTS